MLLVTLLLNIIFSSPIAPQSGDKENDSEKARVIKGQSLMEEVFDRFHINYEMSRTHKVGYYRESMSDSQTLYYLADGIVDIYVPCNLNQIENALIKPIKTRKKAFQELDEEDILLGNASDMARSSIWRPNSFLNKKNRDNYAYRYEKDTIMNGYEISLIEFEPLNPKGRSTGKIYIDQRSRAIVRIDYTPNATESKIWSDVSWSEEFQFVNGAFELMSVKFRGISAESNYQYDAILVMDQLEVLVRIPQSEDYIQENTPLFDKATSDDTTNFWNGYQFLKHHLETETQQFKLSQL